MIADKERKTSVVLVALLALGRRNDPSFASGNIRVSDPAVAVGAQDATIHMHRMVRRLRAVLQFRGLGMAGQALIVLDPDKDANWNRIVAAKMRHNLFRAARFFLDKAGDPRFGMTFQAARFVAVRRHLPGCVIEIHFVAGIAEPGLAVHVLKTGAANGQSKEHHDGHSGRGSQASAFRA
jgi:hypothetical protein